MAIHTIFEGYTLCWKNMYLSTFGKRLRKLSYGSQNFLWPWSSTKFVKLESKRFKIQDSNSKKIRGKLKRHEVSNYRSEIIVENMIANVMRGMGLIYGI